MSDLSTRFGGIRRLYGSAVQTHWNKAHICIIGMGGVGSWVAESLCRSGIGTFTLIDLDDICITNTNRQIHTLTDTIGKPKAEVMANRMRQINPSCKIEPRLEYITRKTADDALDGAYSYVVDAIDDARIKALIIARCRDRKIPVITSGGAGGRCDPTQIETVDLARTRNDRLLLKLRIILRQDYGFPRWKNKKFGIPCVFSPEPVTYPTEDGEVCPQREEAKKNLRLDCESGYGTASFVTGSFGFAMAARVLNDLASQSAMKSSKGTSP